MTRSLPPMASVCLNVVFGAGLGLLGPASLAGDDPPPLASLQATDGEGRLVLLPLEHTEVRGEVAGFVARVEVVQTFGNPFAEPIEATYLFPLPERAAVDDFEMEIGSRRIRGEIHRRAEARQIYEEARSSGYAASLLEQERPNVFTQSVANILPGAAIRVHLRYVDLLPYEDGSFRFLFPMVVGPRYFPGAAGPAGPEPVIDPPVINPPVLRPGFRSGHDVALTLDLDGPVPIGALTSDSHEIVIERSGPRRARVSLATQDRVPNKDFMLRIGVAAELPEVGVIAHRSGEDGFFALQVQPKASIEADEAAPKEILFVLDQSGSMSGAPIEMSKRFMLRALETLGPDDSFNVIRFSSGVQALAPAPLPNDDVSRARGILAVRSMQANGGTEFLLGLREALRQPREPRRLRILFFLSDGFIGNEEQIFDVIRREAGDARVFTLGIGSSVNHYLLREMATLGRGAYQYIRPDGREKEAIERFHAWVTRPYLTDLEIDWGGLQVEDLHPRPLPDLFSGQTLTVVGRYLWAGDETVIVRGRLGGRPWERQVQVHLPERDDGHAVLASVWARARIRELLLGGASRPEIEYQVTSLALSFRLMSPFTSFVAVDDSEVVNPGGEPVLVRQAVPLPEFVSFEGCFGADGPASMQAPAPEPPPEPELDRGVITVEIRDEHGPAQGARVILQAGPDEIVDRQTGGDGIARFDGLEPGGGYRLLAAYRGSLFESNVFKVEAGASLNVPISTDTAIRPRPAVAPALDLADVSAPDAADTGAVRPRTGDPAVEPAATAAPWVPAGSGALQGLVVDADGNPIPGVTVTAAGGPSPVAPAVVATDQQGRYSLSPVSPGLDYEIAAELPGFAKVMTSPVTVEPGKVTTLNVTLVPAAEMTEKITVTGKGDLVDAASTKTATVFSSEFIQGAPILGRTYQDILTLAPGIVDTDVDSGVAGGVVGGVLGGVPGDVPGGVPGGIPSGVDGANRTDPVTGTFGTNLNLESIATIEVITTGASAEFSQAQGGFAPGAASRPAPATDRGQEERLRAALGGGEASGVVEPALRVLADLASDGRLSRAEGVPALAGLLAAQDARGRLGASLTEHALATWALVEAARAYPGVAWLARATDAAVADLRVAAYAGDEWPAIRGAAVDPLATALARLALQSSGIATAPAVDVSTLEAGLSALAGGGRAHLLERIRAGFSGCPGPSWHPGPVK